MDDNPFYLRYYVGHRGKFGHEFLEFEVREDGRVRYANSSNYKSDLMIKKEVYVSSLVVEEFKRILRNSNIEKIPDSRHFPTGKQEFELNSGELNLNFNLSKINSIVEISDEKMKNFYYLILNLKSLIFSIINIHFRIRPV